MSQRSREEKIIQEYEELFSIDSPLGPIHIRTSGNAVAGVEFHRLHADKKSPVNSTGQECAKQLEEYFSGNRTEFTLALKQPGTEFQQRVWTELTSIPFGNTISYLDLAKRLGDPKCIRAAGTANGKNNIAIIVPCHRVIGSNGSLTGYAGGLERKDWLLRHEGSRFPGGQLGFNY